VLIAGAVRNSTVLPVASIALEAISRITGTMTLIQIKVAILWALYTLTSYFVIS
jgi:hypothetical protein